MATVLIVDDDLDTRDVLRLVLEDAGHEVAEAPDGQIALKMLRASAFPLVVILDLLMPRLDGVGVLRAVLEDDDLAARHAYLVLTVMTPSRVATSAPLLSALSAPVVYKPFDVDALLDMVVLLEARVRVA
jgi:CheY-like chemotaxis protein